MIKEVVTFLLLSSLATVGQAISSNDCSHFQGGPVDNAIQVYGIPNSNNTFPSGEQTVTWNRTGIFEMADAGDGIAFAKDRTCRILFTTDKNGLVSSCQYDGYCRKFQTNN